VSHLLKQSHRAGRTRGTRIKTRFHFRQPHRVPAGTPFRRENHILISHELPMRLSATTPALTFLTQISYTDLNVGFGMEPA